MTINNNNIQQLNTVFSGLQKQLNAIRIELQSVNQKISALQNEINELKQQ